MKENARQPENASRTFNRQAKSSIGLILKVLQGIAPAFDYQAEFLKESFEGGKAGYGVRKETFVKIPSGLETKLHLAEIRGDENVDEFLGYGEGVGALNIEWVKEKNKNTL